MRSSLEGMGGGEVSSHSSRFAVKDPRNGAMCQTGNTRVKGSFSI
jgi:hypothetical protein